MLPYIAYMDPMGNQPQEHSFFPRRSSPGNPNFATAKCFTAPCPPTRAAGSGVRPNAARRSPAAARPRACDGICFGHRHFFLLEFNHSKTGMTVDLTINKWDLLDLTIKQ